MPKVLRQKLYKPVNVSMVFVFVACNHFVGLPAEEERVSKFKETIETPSKKTSISYVQKESSFMSHLPELMALTSSPTYSKAPYAQPLSNPQRNSFVVSSLFVQPKISWRFVVPLRSMTLKNSLMWVLTSSNTEQLLVSDIRNYWFIHRTSKTVLADASNHSRALPCFLYDGEQFVYFWEGGPFMPDLTRPNDKESYRDIWFPSFGNQTALHAFIPMEENLIGLVQNYGNRGNSLHRSALIFRKPYERQLRTIKWQYALPEESFPSPALLDGTVVMHLANRLHLVSPEGKLTKEIFIQLDPGNVSVDLGNRIWGFARREQGLLLISLSAEGTQLSQTLLSSSMQTPAQPPVAFADGRVCAITKEGIACVSREGILQWQQTLPEQAQPYLATATGDGFLLVVAGSKLFCLDPNGQIAWQVSAPQDQRISSNPAVTIDGNVCFATGMEIHCLEHP